MATFKNTSMPSNTASPRRSGGGSRILRALLFLIALAAVAAASVGATWMIMTRMQQASPDAAGAVAANAASVEGAPAPAPASPMAAPAPQAPVPPPLPIPNPIFYELAPFTVTVENEVSERILHVGLTLRLADEQSRQRLDSYLPEVRSRVLLELAKLTPDDLKGSQGRVNLAASIVTALNRPFTPMPVGQYVTDVLFTTFVVQ